MDKVDLTRIAENIDTLNALNSLKYVNKDLAVFQSGLTVDKIHNENSEVPSSINIACTFHLGSRGAKHVVYTIGEIKKLMSTMESGMIKIRNLLLKISDNLTEACCFSVDRNQQIVINENIQDWIVEIESIVNYTRWNGMTLFGGNESVTYLEFSSIPERISTKKIYLVSGFDISSLGINRNEVTGYSNTRTNFIEAQSALHDAIKEFDQVTIDIKEFKARLNFMEEILFIVRNYTQLVKNRIMNADMVTEWVEVSTYFILQQTSTALRAQANMTPQYLLTLFN